MSPSRSALPRHKSYIMKKISALRSLLLPGFIALSQSLICLSSFGQNFQGVADREIQRRQSAIPQGEAALARGKAAMQAKNFTLAHEEFRTAVTYLPDAVVSGKAHDKAVEGFCKSGVTLAEQRIAEGRYAEAEAILGEILSDRYDPNCRPAAQLLAHLHQPGYFNKTMGPKFIAKIEEVKALLKEADGYYNSGRYDLAHKKYDQVLNLDPYNVAARRGQEKLDNAKYRYGEEAYNETRARNLWEVEKGWEEPVRQYGQAVAPFADAFARDASGTARITTKLNTIIIPRVEFRDASIREAIDFLRQQAVENDPATEGKKGVDIVLRLAPLGQIAPPPVPVQPAQSPVTAAPAGAGAAAPGTAPATGGAPVTARPVVARPVVAAAATSPADARITITLNQVPLGEALRYIASQAGLKVKVEPYAVSVIPLTEQSNDLITKRYRVPPEFFGGPLDVGYYIGSNVGGGGYGGGQTGGSQSGSAQAPAVYTNVIKKEALSYQTASGVGYGAGATSQANLVQGTSTTRQTLVNDRRLVGRADAKIMLESMGVQFPPGASATFWPHSGTLIVRNTQDNLDFVDALADQANASQPKQVEIESKFVEINQNNLKELGFDWLLGPFSLNGKVFGSGGTAGNGAPINAANFPFNNNGVPVGGPGTGIPND